MSQQTYKEVNIMLRYQDYFEERRKDAVELCEEQTVFIAAQSLNTACVQIGK